MVQSSKILGGSIMLIDKVLFRYGYDTEMITLESIEQHRRYIKVKNHLYCATPNCHCKMIYISEGKRIAHFKKWIGRQHSKQCPYYKETDMDSRPKRIAGTKVAILSDKRIGSVLKQALTKFLETEEDRVHRLAKGKSRARRTSNATFNSNEELFPTSIFINKPTTSNIGKHLAEGDKIPYVRTRRSISEFKESDIGETQATAGFFNSIVYEGNTIILSITDKQKLYPFHLYFEEVFFSNSSEGTRRMLEELEEMLKTLENVAITCIGEIVKKDGVFGMRVMRASNIRINGALIPNFIFEMDSLFNYSN